MEAAVGAGVGVCVGLGHPWRWRGVRLRSGGDIPLREKFLEGLKGIHLGMEGIRRNILNVTG